MESDVDDRDVEEKDIAKEEEQEAKRLQALQSKNIDTSDYFGFFGAGDDGDKEKKQDAGRTLAPASATLSVLPSYMLSKAAHLDKITVADRTKQNHDDGDDSGDIHANSCERWVEKYAPETYLVLNEISATLSFIRTLNDAKLKIVKNGSRARESGTTASDVWMA